MKKFYIPYITTLLCSMTLLFGCAAENEPELPGIPDEDAEMERVVVPVTIAVSGEWNIDPETETFMRPPDGYNPSTGADTEVTDPSDPDGLYDKGVDETKFVNKVCIFTFRRAAGTQDDFVFDPMNSFPNVGFLTQKLYEERENDLYPGVHPHYIFQGEITKLAKYDYRVIAIAYEEYEDGLKSHSYTFSGSGGNGREASFTEAASGFPVKSEADLFMINGVKLDENFTLPTTTKFKDFLLTINVESITGNNADDNIFLAYREGSTTSSNYGREDLSRKRSFGPQFFYGYCHSEEVDDPIISFMEKKKDKVDGEDVFVSDMGLVGILYRGTAKIELRIKKMEKITRISNSDNIRAVYLLADRLKTSVNLSSYDNFLTPSGAVDDGKYTAIGYFCSNHDEESITIETYILQTKTKLALRAFYYYVTGISVHTYTARAETQQIGAYNLVSGEQGTGIISPDVVNHEFYFRRNHKYILTLDKTTDIF